MSPLWRDEIAVFLAPHKLALVRRARGLRQRVIAATELAVPLGAVGDVGPVLARLAETLTDPTWHGATVRAVVADHTWARYCVVPWPMTRLDAAARLTRARYLLGDAYGEVVAGWTITLADTPPGRSYVACAMPAALRIGLEDALAPARLTLLSLQPQLVVAFNAWRHRLPADDTWFVSADQGSLSAVHLENGAWNRVHMARLSADWGVELQRLRALDSLTRAGGAPGRMFVVAPAWMRRGVAASTGIEWLEHGGDDGAQVCELAPLRGGYT